MASQKNFVIALLGPTGAGKSSVAMRLARKLPLELICMDSMQIYSEIEVGNTAPLENEKREVPHHLFGTVSIREAYSAVDWLNDAKQAIRDIHSRGKTPVLVGGTGLYYRLLVDGVSDVPQTPRELRFRLDERCEKKGLASLYKLLVRLDPDAADLVHRNDRQRVQRFLEIRIMTGRSVKRLWEKGRKSPLEFPIFTIGLSVPRKILRLRIRERLNEMLCSGWVDEVIDLQKKGLRPDIEKRGPLGYHILFEMLENSFLCFDEATERIDIATRRYAKRQMTWFQNISEIKWFTVESDTGYNLEQMTNVILKLIGNGSYIS